VRTKAIQSQNSLPQQFHCRVAVPSDVPVLAKMNKDLIRDEGHRNSMTLLELEERMTGFLGSGYTAVLFYEKDFPIGYALFRIDPEWLYLRQFLVQPEYRRKGYGKAALAWMKKTVWSAHPRIRIEVLVGNKSGLAFWHSVGFQDYCVTMELQNEVTKPLD